MGLSAASDAGNMLRSAASAQGMYADSLSGLFRENETARMNDALADVRAQTAQAQNEAEKLKRLPQQGLDTNKYAVIDAVKR